MVYKRINKQGNLVEFKYSSIDHHIAMSGLWNNPQRYVVGIYKGKHSVFARVVMNAKRGQIVDHINGDPSDNRRSNLRICTQSDNCKNQKLSTRNTSGHKGVVIDKKTGKYIAQIRSKGKDMYLGTFANIEDAIKVRREAESKYFGEFRRKDDK